MNFWVLIYRVALIVVSVLVVIGVICVFLPKCHRFQELQRQKIALTEQCARVEARVRQLESNRERFNGESEFVERIAREQGMAKPGETIFKFSEVSNAAGRAVKP
jgi:cell division protein FtsB